MEQKRLEREQRKAIREAKAEENRQYNAAAREEIKEANARHRAAMHLDFIEMQKKRAQLTATFFPAIASSHWYQEYVQRNINRNTRQYNHIMRKADIEFGVNVDVVPTPVAEEAVQ